MNKILVSTLILFTALSVTTYAGGKKGVVLAETPVEPIPAVEPDPVYIGAGLVWGRYNDCSVPSCAYEDVTYGGMLRAGYEWNQYFGLEARLLATTWKADPLGGQKLQHAGVFTKPMYPVIEDTNLYALIGYGWTKTRTGGNGNLPTIDDSGSSAGIGLEYDLSDKEDDLDEDGYYDREFDGQADQEQGWGLFLDYQRLLLDSNAPDLDVVSAGVTWDF